MFARGVRPIWFRHLAGPVTSQREGPVLLPGRLCFRATPRPSQLDRNFLRQDDIGEGARWRRIILAAGHFVEVETFVRGLAIFRFQKNQSTAPIPIRMTGYSR